MKPKTKPTNNNLVEELYKYSIHFEGNKIYVPNTVSPVIVEMIYEKVSSDFKIVYFDIRELEDDCSTKLVCNGTVEFKLNKKIPIFKQKYICYSEDDVNYLITMIPEYINKSCNYTIDIQVKGLNISQVCYLSYGSKAELINNEYNLSISRQSIYTYEKIKYVNG